MPVALKMKLCHPVKRSRLGWLKNSVNSLLISITGNSRARLAPKHQKNARSGNRLVRMQSNFSRMPRDSLVKWRGGAVCYHCATTDGIIGIFPIGFRVCPS
jgi:hypothetical protein